MGACWSPRDTISLHTRFKFFGFVTVTPSAHRRSRSVAEDDDDDVFRCDKAAIMGFSAGPEITWGGHQLLHAGYRDIYRLTLTTPQ